MFVPALHVVTSSPQHRCWALDTAAGHGGEKHQTLWGPERGQLAIPPVLECWSGHSEDDERRERNEDYTREAVHAEVLLLVLPAADRSAGRPGEMSDGTLRDPCAGPRERRLGGRALQLPHPTEPEDPGRVMQPLPFVDHKALARQRFVCSLHAHQSRNRTSPQVNSSIPPAPLLGLRKSHRRSRLVGAGYAVGRRTPRCATLGRRPLRRLRSRDSRGPMQVG